MTRGHAAVALACAVLLVSRTAVAQSLYPEKILGQAEAAGLAVAMPSEPMRPGVKTLGVMPMYITADLGWKQAEVTNGPGIAASFDYYKSRHFGAGAMLVGEEATGRWPAENSVSLKGSGYLASGYLLYDPFSGENFGLPLLLGLSQSYDDLETSQPVNGYPQKTTANGFGLMLGLSPQFNLWKLRLAPYGALSLSPNPSGCTNDSNNCHVAEYDPSFPYQTVGGAGISVIWRPWNLAFTSSMTTSVGTSAYTLKWTKSFGGAPSAPAEAGGKS